MPLPSLRPLALRATTDGSASEDEDLPEPVVHLLADHGFAPRTAFVSELGERLRRRLLPGTPETTEAGALFDLVFDQAVDARWLKALDPALLARAHTLLFANPDANTAPWHQVLQDAVVYATSAAALTEILGGQPQHSRDS